MTYAPWRSPSLRWRRAVRIVVAVLALPALLLVLELGVMRERCDVFCQHCFARGERVTWTVFGFEVRETYEAHRRGPVSLSRACEALDGVPCRHQWATGLDCSGRSLFGFGGYRGTCRADVGYEFVSLPEVPEDWRRVLNEDPTLIARMRDVVARGDLDGEAALVDEIEERMFQLWLRDKEASPTSAPATTDDASTANAD